MEIISAKKIKSVVAVYGIIAFVCILAFLIIPFEKSAASWISGGFALISLVVSLFVCWYAFKGADDLKSKVYGIPVLRIGYLYPIAQFIFSIVICIISIFVYVPYWITLLVSVVMLALAAIGLIATDNTRDTVIEIEQEEENATRTSKYFKLNMASIVDSCTNEEAKAVLIKLEDDFKYSDPVSSEATQGLEAKIASKLYELQNVCSQLPADKVIEMANEIKLLLVERNRVCKANKR